MADFLPEPIVAQPLSTSSESCPESGEEVNRRGFLQHVAVGGVAIGSWTGATMAYAEDSEPNDSGLPTAVDLQLTVNERVFEIQVDPRVTLLDLLRNHLNLTGTKKGCDHGQCGACTVLVNGRRIYSCLSLAAMQSGAEITTIEGLAKVEELHPLQMAFIERDAFQCGFCTSGQICSAVGLMNEGHARSESDVRELMSGNLCRCGAYLNILRAIRDVQTGQQASD